MQPDPQPSSSREPKYWAFISYSHRDRAWGAWLHRGLETYRVPKLLVGEPGRDGPVPRQVSPVFRDREELPTASDLGTVIHQALVESRYLIVVCSPRAAASRWVNEEILTFKRLGRSDRILCLIVDGEPNQGAALECFPEALRYALDEHGNLSQRRVEPIAADARPVGDGKHDAKLKLLAGIIGIDYDRLKQRELIRRQGRLRAVAAAAIGAASVLLGLLAWALLAQSQANHQRIRAESEKAEAEAQKNRANQKLAYSYVLRARQEDDVGGALLYAEANAAFPSPLAAANARAALGSSCGLLAYLVHGPATGVDVDSVAFSPDGRIIATGSGDGSCRLWNSETGEPVGPAMQHSDGIARTVRALAFNADGSRLATGGLEGLVRVWDVRTGASIGKPVKGPFDARVEAVAFSPDGARVYRWSGSDEFVTADARTGDVIAQTREFRTGVDHLAISPDRTKALLGSSSGSGRLWDLETGRPFGDEIRHSGSITAVAFSPDGKWIATGSIDDSVVIRDARTAREVHRLDFDSSMGDIVVAFGTDSDMIATARGTHLSLWNWRTSSAVTVRHDGPVLCVAFAPDGKHVFSGGGDKTLRIWGVPSGDPVRQKIRHAVAVHRLVVSPDGRRLVTPGPGNSVCLWALDLHGGEPQELLHDDGVSRAEFCGRRRILTSSGTDLDLWDAGTLTRLRHADVSDHPMVDWALSADGRRVATGSTDHFARVWDVETLQPVGKAMEHDYEWVKFVRFSPDGRRLATGSKKTARLWDVESGEPVGEAMERGDWITSLQFTPDGTHVVTADQSGPARLWDGRTGTAIKTVFPNDNGGEFATFSRDARFVVTSHFSLPARIYDVSAARPVGPPIEHDGRVSVAAFRDDGQCLAIASGSTVLLVNPRTGLKIGKTLRHVAAVRAICFSPDGNWIATAGEDQTARLWESETGEPVGDMLFHGGAVLDVRFSPDGRTLLTASLDSRARMFDVSYLGGTPSPGAFHVQAQVRLGIRLDPYGEFEVIPPDEWRALGRD